MSKKVSKAQRLETLRQICLDCRSCSLYKTRNNLVFGEGNPDAKIMFIAEAPGRDEDEQGRPFVGRSGKLLRALIKAINLPEESYYIANILKCRPPNNRTPEPNEIRVCILYLKKQIEIIQPKFLVLLGKTAVTGIIPDQKDIPMEVLRSYRGNLFFDKIPVVVTYHPSAVLRNPYLKTKVAEDFRYIQKIIK